MGSSPVKRANHRPERESRSTGTYDPDFPGRRRLVSFYDDDEYARLDERAQAIDVATGELQRRIVRAWLDDEPHPIFIGANEHS